MNVAFFSEGGYVGKVPRNHPNMRTDLAWVSSLQAVHHPITSVHTIPKSSYDVGVVIVPKNKQHLLDYPLLEELKRVCRKICVMQEGTYWMFQEHNVQSQIWYYNLLQSVDLILCHNDVDLLYYKGITDTQCELMPTLMITDYIKIWEGEKSGVMIGGNWGPVYRGFDSYVVSKVFEDNISAITSGRIKEDENLLDINHLPWVNWLTWMYELSKFKYGVHLGVPGAGIFNLNCAYLGIPCIGHKSVNTQKYLHPDLAIEEGNIEKARQLAHKLSSDEEFYKYCSTKSKKLFNKLYSENEFTNKLTKILL